MPKLASQAASIAPREDGTLTIAVIADTHSHPHAGTHAHLRALAPDAILHAGDIGDAGVITDLAAIAPVHVVRGNIDTRATFPDVLTVDVAGRLRIYLTHIAVNGPRLRADVARQAKAAGAQLVVCGHSHVPFIGSSHGLTVFNPGSAGPRRFSLPIVFGTIKLTPARVALSHVSCETGAAWSPP